MTTDNRTNEPNKYAGFIARQEHQRDQWRGIGKKCLCGVVFDSDVDHAMHQVEAILEAALVAVQGAAPQAENEPMYSLVSRQWSGACPCVRAEQVDPECGWHGRPEFRIGGEFHHDSPGVEIVTKAARVLHVATCCKLSAGSKHQEPQNEDMFTAGVVLNSVPLAAPVQPSSAVDEAALIREAKAEAWDEGHEAFEEAWRSDNLFPYDYATENPYREGSET